jgi:hypothetical protein
VTKGKGEPAEKEKEIAALASSTILHLAASNPGLKKP